MSDSPRDRAAEAFHLQATDPEGKKYYLDASPTTAMAFPVILGGGGGPTTSGLLGAMNRLLARVQPALKEEEGALLQVHMDGERDPLQFDFRPTMQEAKDLAGSIMAAIEAGEFVPRRPT